MGESMMFCPIPFRFWPRRNCRHLRVCGECGVTDRSFGPIESYDKCVLEASIANISTPLISYISVGIICFTAGLLLPFVNMNNYGRQR
jgi:hypothetical protein